MFNRGVLFVVFLSILIKSGKMLKPMTRIFGGEDTNRGDLPYMALVKQLVRGDICGGAIISERHILTGGMCAKYHTRPFDRSIVITGTVSLNHGGKVHRIIHAIAHPLFHKHYPDNIRYDIGVVTVCDDIKFNLFQRPIKLPTGPVKDGEEAIISGWGHTETEKNPDILQKLVTKVYTPKTCAKMAQTKSFSDGSRICTKSEKGKGFCNFDNGSPLVVNGVVVGIASLLFGCGIGEIDQYANVYRCINFISEEMKSGCSKPNLNSFLVEKNNHDNDNDDDDDNYFKHDSDNDNRKSNLKINCKTCFDECWAEETIHDYNFYV
ncbi:chymotrypsin-1-like [Leptopilina boulardi]|uniref:chymotrypsin-1-like n=1 Tax=Leptopilina boulardi TaxID=63433 RepID=UPI0021F6906C|nr:chymotrypsin-1-like [Leptopilina boulardi]